MFLLLKARTILVITAVDAVKILFFWWESLHFFLLCVCERELVGFFFLDYSYFYLFIYVLISENVKKKTMEKEFFSGEIWTVFVFMCETGETFLLQAQ